MVGGARPETGQGEQCAIEFAAPGPTPTRPQECAIELDLRHDDRRQAITAEPGVIPKRWPWALGAVAVVAGLIALVSAGIYLRVGGIRDVPNLPAAQATRETAVPTITTAESVPPSIDHREGPAPPARGAPLSPEGKALAVTPPKSAPTTPALPASVATGPKSAPENVVSTAKKDRPETEPSKRLLSSFDEQVERTISAGARFLKSLQQPDGSWRDVEPEAKTGTTSLITLALLAAGESAESPPIRKALEFLRRFKPSELSSTYAISLQTMVYAAIKPAQDRMRIAANAGWLERAQMRGTTRSHRRVHGLIPKRETDSATTPTRNTRCSVYTPRAKLA